MSGNKTWDIRLQQKSSTKIKNGEREFSLVTQWIERGVTKQRIPGTKICEQLV